MADGGPWSRGATRPALISPLKRRRRTSIAFVVPIVLAALALSSAEVRAEETIESRCENGDLVRRVVVAERRLSSGLSCEVIYWKDTEAPGERQILWTARQDAGYCYSKALVLIGRLTSTGWSCDLGSAPEEPPAHRSPLGAGRASSS